MISDRGLVMAVGASLCVHALALGMGGGLKSSVTAPPRLLEARLVQEVLPEKTPEKPHVEPPPPQPREHPLKSLLAAFRFLLASPLIGGIALLGGLLTMASAVRVLYPALAIEWQMGASQIGLLYAAIPLGAAFGALTSGNLAQSTRPGLIMLSATVASFIAIDLFSLMPFWALGVVCLALFGWLSAISSLLQYTLIQTQTPEGMLGRINGLWTAQNVTGDAIGAAVLGGLGVILTPVASASSSGFVLAIVGAILLMTLTELRRFRQEVVLKDSAA